MPDAAPNLPPRTSIFSPEAIRRVGVREPWRGDLYHRLITLRWWAFVGLGTVFYLAVNAVFAGLYLVQPGSIAGARPGSVTDAFFFSVETIATIGYGVLSPGTLYANVLMLIETIVGILIVAVATGVVFARVSRPTARVLFAKVATVATWNGLPTLFLRMGNERRSQILEADVAMYLLRFETSPEGVSLRRFHKLRLERGHTPVFSLSYTAIHPIAPDSPLHGATRESLVAEEAELIVTVTGLEEATGQTVHARCRYPASDVLWGRRYADIFVVGEDGERFLDYRRFDETVPA
jgi:inward rectifier potassium channel